MDHIGAALPRQQPGEQRSLPKSEALSAPQSAASTGRPSSSTPARLPDEAVSTVLTRLRAMHGDAFDRRWTGVAIADLRDTWAAGLAGISGHELAAGLRAAAAHRWVPTLPEFAAMCQPWRDPQAGFELAQQLMRQRIAGRHTDWPAVWLWAAAQRMGGDLLALPWDKASGRWESAVSTARRDADAGRLPAAVPEFVPGNTLALPRPGQARITRDEAVRSLSALLERCAARRAEKGK